MIWVLAVFGTIVLFFIFPKQMAYLAGAVILLVGALFAYNSYTSTVRANRLKNVFVLIDRSITCPADYPIPITINNASDKTITALSFTLRAFHPGFSDSVYEAYYTSTKIQAPNEFYSACYAPMAYGWAASARPEEKTFSFNGLSWAASASLPQFKD